MSAYSKAFRVRFHNSSLARAVCCIRRAPCSGGSGEPDICVDDSMQCSQIVRAAIIVSQAVCTYVDEALCCKRCTVDISMVVPSRSDLLLRLTLCEPALPALCVLAVCRSTCCHTRGSQLRWGASCDSLWASRTLNEHPVTWDVAGRERVVRVSG